ncbi:MAG TPA: hypothetical protein VFO85_12750, partial [Vicinamibacteria bacterium]|nr:hypothetical protein [Vicinamibacteria bacterium]
TSGGESTVLARGATQADTADVELGPVHVEPAVACVVYSLATLGFVAGAVAGWRRWPSPPAARLLRSAAAGLAGAVGLLVAAWMAALAFYFVAGVLPRLLGA